MKVRIISGAVAIALLVTIVLLPAEVLGVAVFILALAGVHEFYGAVSRGGYRPVKAVGYLACIPLLVIGLSGNKALVPGIGTANAAAYLSFCAFVLLAVACAVGVFRHKSHNILDISLTVFGVLYVAFLFSFVTLTRNLQNGQYYIWMIFIGASVTDTFAYFTGIAMGKRKLIPEVSPKKTVEGSIGGMVGCIAAMAAYGAYLNHSIGFVPLYHYVIIGLLCGIISQVGDLTASTVKRFIGIKDYGNIMPGHGGVLDRVDSTLFVAPVIYFYIRFIMMG